MSQKIQYVQKQIDVTIKVKVQMQVRVEKCEPGGFFNVEKDLDIDYINREDLESQIDTQIIAALRKEKLIERADSIGGHMLIGFADSIWQKYR